MKKTFLAILVAATLVACAKEDVISQNNEAIGFKQAFVDNSVRSTVDPSFSNDNLFASFAVYGTVENAPLFNNVEVKGSGFGETGTWTYEGTQYWIAGAKYNFAAIAPYAKGKEGAFKVAKVDENYVGTTTLTGYVNDNTDLLYAQSAQVEGATSGNKPVAFTFRHTLSKVKFSFKNGYNASNATIKVSEIKINNPYETATVALTADATTWSDQALGNNFILDFGKATDDESTADDKESAEVAFAYGKTYESYNELLLIPGTATKLAEADKAGYKVTFKVYLLVNGTQVADYEHIAYVDFTPVAGCTYDINAEITATNIDPEHAQEPIEFTVTAITDWDKTDESQTLPIPGVTTPAN